MVRRNFLFLVVMIGVAVFAGACTKDGTDGSAKKNGDKSGQHGGAETANGGLIEFIKKQKLVNYPSATIGSAFDSYKHLEKKEWTLEAQKSGQFTVEFIGWLETAALSYDDVQGGIANRGLDVTFVVETNGSFYVFMVSKIEAGIDGKIYRYQVADVEGILSKIYANKRIIF